MKRLVILAVANDAGGAEVLSSYLRQKLDKFYLVFCVVKGPALRIFCKKNLGKNLLGINTARELVSKGVVNLVLTSTSYYSDLERQFIMLAKKKHIKSISILEHWINYRERFGFPKKGWEKNLPDEIWVCDTLAKKISLVEFKGLVTTKKKRNYYWRDLRDEYRKSKIVKDNKYFKILFLGGVKNGGNSIKKIIELIKFLRNYSTRKLFFLKIRPHPSEEVFKYQALVSKNFGRQNLEIALGDTQKESLVKELKGMDLIIGVDSITLVISSFFGKKTVCFNTNFPIWLKKHKVLQMKNFKDLGIILDKITKK